MSARPAPRAAIASGSGAARTRAFTLLEMIVVVVISSSLFLTVSLFFQRSLAMYRLRDDEARLDGRMQLLFERLRPLAAHSVSAFNNFQNAPPFAAQRAIDSWETLFFLTDAGHDGAREAHFIWYDRFDASLNEDGTDLLIHAWKEIASFPLVIGQQFMPPDMSAASFSGLLDYLRDRSNFNAGGAPTQVEGWEVLLDGRADPDSGARQVALDRWSPPPWLSGEPPRGLAFNVELLVAGVPPLSLYLPNPMLDPARGLWVPYERIPNDAYGAHNFQVWADVYSDRNGNESWDAEEARYQLVTTVNLRLVPSAG